MGDILRGNTSISNIYRGQDQVSKVYRGQTEIWSPSGPIPVPPVTADVFDFNANYYSGTGDWIDQSLNAYPATPVGSPTLGGSANSKFIDCNGTTDGFVVANTFTKAKIWDSQLVTGQAIGSFEVLVNLDTVSGRFFTAWGELGNNRAVLFGINTSTSISALFRMSAGSQTFASITVPTITTGVWLHYVIRFNQNADSLNIRHNGATLDFPGGFVSTTSTWNGNANLCNSLMHTVSDCNFNPREFTDGKVAAIRGYNNSLSNAEADSLAAFWATYY